MDKLVKAIELFHDLEKGILHTIKAADVYTVYLIAIARGVEPDQPLIQEVITNNKISSFTVLRGLYTEKERKELDEKGCLINIGNQILLATHTALEVYLKNKFAEYFRFQMKAISTERTQKLLERFLFRSLDDTKEFYKDILGIHLSCFEIDKDFIFDDDSPSRRRSAWDYLGTIERARNEIAHEGKPKAYKIKILPDVWEPFELVRRWVTLFDANFDQLVYEGRSTHLINEYQKRITKREHAPRAR